MKKNKKTQPKELIPEWGFKYIFLPILLTLVIAHLLTSYFGVSFMWGIHHLHFFPKWAGWIFAFATILFFVPSINNYILTAFEAIFTSFKKKFSKTKKYSLYFILSLLSLPLFWFLRTKLYLLGDGYFKIRQLPPGELVPTEWLDGVIHLEFYKFLSKVSPGLDPSLSYSILSVLCGGIFVFLILLLSDLLGKTNFQKILIFSLLFSLGSIELFFGYVESYTILLVGLTAFLLFSVLYVRGKASIIFPLITLVLSIGLHVSVLALVPSFFYLIFGKPQKEKKGPVHLLTIISLVVCFALISFAIWKVFFQGAEGGGFTRFLPLFPSARTNFTLFCGEHISEFVNQLLLISPVGILSFAFFLFYAIRYKDFSVVDRSAYGGNDRILNLLLISSIFSLTFIFIYDSKLGRMDWDLRSFPGIFFTLLGILLFIKYGNLWMRFKNYGLILIMVSFFHTVPWILVNANKQFSLERYVLMAKSDPHAQSKDDRGIWRVGRILDYAGLTEEAEEIFKHGLEKNPKDLGNYSYLGKHYFQQGKYDQAIIYLEKAIQLEPRSESIRFLLGRAYARKMEFQKALFHLERVKNTYRDDPLLVHNLAMAYLVSNRAEEAKGILQEFLAKNPESALMHGLLGTSFFLLKDSSNARKEWELASQLDPDDSYAKTALEVLKKITEK
jgi:tetratricopeptide (TPR) repeat protein